MTIFDDIFYDIFRQLRQLSRLLCLLPMSIAYVYFKIKNKNKREQRCKIIALF